MSTSSKVVKLKRKHPLSWSKPGGQLEEQKGVNKSELEERETSVCASVISLSIY